MHLFLASAGFTVLSLIILLYKFKAGSYPGSHQSGYWPIRPTDIALLTSRQMLYVLGETDRDQGQGQRQRQWQPVNSSSSEYLNYIRAHVTRHSPGPRNLIIKAKRREVKDYSSNGHSTLIDSLLRGRRDGFFVECGAWDGEVYSNSLFFELYRNWTGLLVEANPALHRQLLAKNRKAYTTNSCLSPTGRPTQLTYSTADNGVGGIDNYTIELYTKAINRSHHSTKSRVPCFPLSDILAALQVTRVDYLSLDVDGAELEILQSIDWKRVRIDTLTVEFVGTGKLEALRKFFDGTDFYREVGVIANEISSDLVLMTTADLL